MKKTIVVISLLAFSSVVLFFLTVIKKPIESEENQIKIAVLSKSSSHQSNIFFYDPITLEDFHSENLRENSYRNASALFIFPEYFSKVSEEEYRDILVEIAHHLPVVFIDSGNFKSLSLFNTNLSYEEIIKNSGFNEYIQVMYYFSNGEDCIYRTDGFTMDNQRELAQAIQIMNKTNSYIEWERAYYEY